MIRHECVREKRRQARAPSWGHFKRSPASDWCPAVRIVPRCWQRAKSSQKFPTDKGDAQESHPPRQENQSGLSRRLDSRKWQRLTFAAAVAFDEVGIESLRSGRGAAPSALCRLGSAAAIWLSPFSYDCDPLNNTSPSSSSSMFDCRRDSTSSSMPPYGFVEVVIVEKRGSWAALCA